MENLAHFCVEINTASSTRANSQVSHRRRLRTRWTYLY